MSTGPSTPQKLYLLQIATSTVPGASRMLEMVLGCYLVETSDGKHILIPRGSTAA
jgi:N-acyl homoserine lactone hydrolase